MKIMKRTFNYTITSEYSGKTVERYLKDVHSYSSKLIRTIRRTSDGILKNNERAYTIHKLSSGDILTINIDEPPSETIEPVRLDLDIVYEDEDIMIIDKPPGMPSQPSADNRTNSVANAVIYYFLNKGIGMAYHAVNRLDKDTSGLMAIAKNPYVHAVLADKLHTNDFFRKYICLVHGVAENSGTVDIPIGRKEGSAIERTVAENGQRAVTHYRKIGEYGDFSLLEIVLETGRTHQIRVHMSYIGHPLVGDFLYGEEERDFAPRQMLHSAYMSFTHPVSGEKAEFISSIPADMEKIINELKTQHWRKP